MVLLITTYVKYVTYVGATLSAAQLGWACPP